MATGSPDPYAVLGVPATATPEEITRAYRRLVRRLHPDTGPPASGDAEDLRRVLAAYEVLRDPRRRASYDALSRPAVPSAPPRPAPRPRRPAPARTRREPLLLWASPVRRHDPPAPGRP